jgi:tetratricopeptide (TPR) repeat protein
MMNNGTHVEALRQRGLAAMREGDLEQSLALFEEALSLAQDDETRELVSINKASVLISLDRSGAEVQELPRVIMRRRNLRHVYLAAYWLQYKHRLENDLKRAVFYGQLALRTAEEANETSWTRPVLIELGTNYYMDSHIESAIESFEQALAITEEADNHDRGVSLGYALENLGYCKLLQEKYKEGLILVHQSLEYIHDRESLCEAYIDLCYGYIGTGDLEEARMYGERGLELAVEARQVRNAHYLLGEAAYKAGDSDLADYHFDKLATFYPGFKHLKDLLYAIDLRGMVNLKL